MKTKQKILLNIAICIIGFNSVFAQTANWAEVEGIYGGMFSDIQIHPTDNNIAYLSSDFGLYKTIDKGENWFLLDLNIEGIPETTTLGVMCIVIDPLHPDILYISVDTESGGIFKSIDAGLNWNRINYSNGWYSSIAINSINTDTVYFADGHLYMSIDGGENWEFLFDETTSIFIAPNNPNILIALKNQDDNIVYMNKSVNGGADWEQIGLDISNIYIKQVIIDPENPDIMYFTSGSPGDGLYKSLNGGVDWVLTSLNWDAAQGETHIVNNSPNILFSASEWGIYKSNDSGANWETSYQIDGHPYVLAVSKDGQVIYADNRGQLIKSIDGGLNWTVSQTSLICYSVNDLLFHDFYPDTIMVGTGNARLYISDDNGNNWIQKNAGWDNAPMYTKSFCTDPDDVDIIYYVGGWSVYKSYDGGNTASIIQPNEVWDNYYKIITNYENGDVFLTSDNGIYFSSNGGVSWDTLSLDLAVKNIPCIEIMPSDHNQILAGSYGGGIYKSVDYGNNWTAINNSLTNWNINTLAIDETNTNIIYTGTIDGEGSLFKTIDGGENWTVSNNGLPENANIQDIEIDPEHSDTIYLATQQNGIYVSPNAGENWYSISDELPDMNILCIEKRPEGLYAGSRSKGLLLGDITSIPNSINDKIEPRNIISVFPNPSNGQITIEINNKAVNNIFVEITNINGQVIYNKQFNSVNKTEQIDLTENAKGIYFVRVKSKDFEKIGKLIIE